MNRSIFVDIDGTLADIRHRVHHITSRDDTVATKTTDWDAFYADIKDDKPIVPTIELVRSLYKNGCFIILITGRDAARVDLTKTWLKAHDVPWDVLLMRPIGDHRPDVKIKREWLHKIRDGELTFHDVPVPAIAIEDRQKVVDMWREEGLIALQCDVGDF